MKAVLAFLKYLGLGILIYPLCYIGMYFEGGGYFPWLWWVALICDFTSIVLTFLIHDLRLVDRIRKIKNEEDEDE